MQIGVTNMDSNTVTSQTETQLNNGAEKEEAPTFFLKKEVKIAMLNALKQHLPPNWEVILEKHGAVLAGGSFVSAYKKHPINDLDIFFPTLKQANACLRELSLPVFKSRMNLRDGLFQFIRFKEFSSVQELLNSFDVSAACVAYDFSSRSFHYTQHAAEDIHNNQFRLLKRTNLLSVTCGRIAKWKEQKEMQVHPSTWEVLAEYEKISDEEILQRSGFGSYVVPSIVQDNTHPFEVRQQNLFFVAPPQQNQEAGVLGAAREALRNQPFVPNW